MFKKTMLILTLALSLTTLGAALAQAQTPGGAAIPPEMLEALAKEKPMAQADIDGYIKAMPVMVKAMTDQNAAAEMFKAAGMTEVRFSYVAAKVGLGMALASGATPEQMQMDQIPEIIRPSKADIDLVKKNMDALQKAAADMAKAMAQ